MHVQYIREDLGDAVKITLSQGAAFVQGPDDEPQLCLILNGHPSKLVAISIETGKIVSTHELVDTESVTAICQHQGQLYFSGPKRLFRYDPVHDELIDLGNNPCDSITVWDLTAGDDGLIYGSCYPDSRLFAYDPVLRSFTNLGSAMEGEDYARGIHAQGDLLYIGIGTKAHIMLHSIADGRREELLFEYSGQTDTIRKVYPVHDKLLILAGQKLWVTERESGKVIRTLRCDGILSPSCLEGEHIFYFKSNQTLCRYDAASDTAELLDKEFQWPDTEIKSWGWLQLKQGPMKGRTVLAGMAAFAEIVFYDPETKSCRMLHPEVEGLGVPIQSLHCAPDGRIIAGGYHRGISIYDPEDKLWSYTNAHFRQIEGMFNHKGIVYFGTYRHANIFRYDPAKPITGDVNTKEGNPGFCFAPGELQDRPFVFAGGEEEWYAGSIPDYGQLAGALMVYRDNNSSAEEEVWIRSNIIPDQSIAGLAYRDGLLYGSTTIYGGLGVSPKASEAKLFIWDTNQRVIVKESVLRIDGQSVQPYLIGGLSFGPDDLLWGAASGDGLLFALNPATLEVVKWKRLYPGADPGSKWRPHSIHWSRSGMMWTTAGRHLSLVNPQTMEHIQIMKETDVMAVGNDETLYCASGSRMVALRLKA